MDTCTLSCTFCLIRVYLFLFFLLHRVDVLACIVCLIIGYCILVKKINKMVDYYYYYYIRLRANDYYKRIVHQCIYQR